jgi:hypothetical protein
MDYMFNKEHHAEKLNTELNASGLPYTAFTSLGNDITIIMSETLDESQQTTLNTLISTHDATPPVVIADVTARQIRVALFLVMNITEADIDAAINTLGDPTKTVAMIEWKQSNMFERNRPLVTVMGQMLGKTDAELDALWTYAATI